jgi:hypothetical protein
MTDGCKHEPPKNLGGYEADSFTSGPHCTKNDCKLTKACDSSHIFVLRNFHLYDVNTAVDAKSYASYIEVCDETEYPATRTEWHMAGKVLAAPYRPPRNALPYREVRLPTDVHSVLQKTPDWDYIEVDYSIVSPVNSLPMNGTGFSVPVQLS